MEVEGRVYVLEALEIRGKEDMGISVKIKNILP